MKMWLQHHLNPLHIFARLCDAGFEPRRAAILAGFYERLIFSRLGLI